LQKQVCAVRVGDDEALANVAKFPDGIYLIVKRLLKKGDINRQSMEVR